MAGFNYNHFKEALQKGQVESHQVLMDDIDKVKAFVEKGLTLFLESSTNIAQTKYHGID